MKDAACWLKEGMEGERGEDVRDCNVASQVGSGSLDVYATPSMIALMEGAAVECVGDCLPEGWTTVGMSLDVRHLAPTTMGGRIRARATLVEIAGRRLGFEVTVFDDVGKVGEGRHQRYCVNEEDFLQGAVDRTEQ